MSPDSFAALASEADPQLDRLALAMAAEFRPVGTAAALAELDSLAAEVAPAAGGTPRQEAEALRSVLGDRHGFVGDSKEYDHPDNSMLDLVLARRKGLPILLSVLYVEVARRAGIALAGVGLPGHYVAGHFGTHPPLLIDPFAGGGTLELGEAMGAPRTDAHATALRMLNNLVGSYLRRGDLARGIRAAELRLELPLADDDAAALDAELQAIRARLN